MRAIRITIEELNGPRKIIHQDFQEIPIGMTVARLVRFMLERAGEKFRESTEPARHD